jgi:hypothetical protein
MVAPGLAIGGGGMVASALGTLIAPATTNAETARRAGVAKSYSVDIPTFDAWDTLAKQYDMNGENIGDLFEEYLHKAGEYKQNGKQGSLQDAFDTLGFKAGDLAGLSDMAQFEKIVERALSLQDESKASFALDSLFGGEASKLLMLMKQSGKSYRDLMDEQRRYNLVTKEGAEGAMEGNRAITNLKTVFSSAMAEISGQLGNELAPDVRHLTDDLAEWFKGGGIKRIVSFLRNDLYPGVLTFGQGIVFVGKVVYALAKKLSWMLPDERSDQRDVLKSLAMTGSVDIARMTAQRNGQGEWFEQQLKEKPELPDDVKQSYQDTRGFFRDDEEAFDTTLDKYLTHENSGGLFGPNGLMKPAQQQSVTPGTGPKAWDNYPQTLLAPLPPETSPQVVLGRTEPDSRRQTGVPRTVPLSGNADGSRGNAGTDAEGRWDMLLQKLDTADTAPVPRQLTDNRRFEYRFEIHGAPGQDERGIADEVEAVTKSNTAFTGDSSMLDGGQIW